MFSSCTDDDCDHPESDGIVPLQRVSGACSVEADMIESVASPVPNASGGSWSRPVVASGASLDSMAELDEFLGWVSNDLRAAEVALHDGDATARRAIWSRREPVTVFGAWRDAVGRAEADELFTFLERSFSGCTSHAYEIVAADVIGDMAYTVGLEHTQVIVDGADRTYTLRVTQVYRREAGGWKVVHRHADTPPDQP
jgi:ketosteroid isomerase-like protein